MATVRFRAMERTWETEAAVGTTLLQAARASGAPEGDACGGVCACSTCHLYVGEGLDLLTEASEKEEDILDKAFDVQMSSRLGCQAKIEQDGLIEVDIARESLDAFYNEHPNEKDPRKAG